MKYLSADEARSLAIKNSAVMSIFSEGYSSDFKKAPSPVDHGRGIYYQDLFWALKPFSIFQNKQLIIPNFT